VGLLIPCSQELVGSNPTPRAYMSRVLLLMVLIDTRSARFFH